MKNIFEVIKAKEAQIQQLQKELETLKAAAALLSEGEASENGKGAAPGGPQANWEPAKRWP